MTVSRVRACRESACDVALVRAAAPRLAYSFSTRSRSSRSRAASRTSTTTNRRRRSRSPDCGTITATSHPAQVPLTPQSPAGTRVPPRRAAAATPAFGERQHNQRQQPSFRRLMRTPRKLNQEVGPRDRQRSMRARTDPHTPRERLGGGGGGVGWDKKKKTVVAAEATGSLAVGPAVACIRII